MAVETIRLLLVEDSEDDAGLILASLRRADVTTHHIRVDSEATLREQLSCADWDVVITDYALPGFDGLLAASIVRQHDPELPVILISGVLGEERAIRAMRAGVRDFINKSSLARLEVVVDREVREARQRRATLSALSTARSNARAIVQTLPIPLLIVDKQLRIVMANPYFREAFAEGASVEGRSVSAFSFCEGAVMVQRLKKLVEHGRTFLGVEVVRSDPREQILVLSGERLAGADSLALLTIQDITHQRVRERQKASRERLESLGRLAGGIAHDFNNILCIIQGHATLIEDRESGARAKNVKRISEAVLRASRLTGQLLAFSRQESLTLQLIDLRTVVESIKPMLESALGETITLTLKPGAEPAVVRADLSRLEQVVMNLVFNARDAMPGGGALKISLQTEARLVRMAVEDTGEGMTPQVLRRLFEPFFTTREMGTGLGLATVHGIVEQLGGQIEVESVLGLGSRLTVTCPRVIVATTSPEAATILLVEDEAELLEITRRMLARRGFQVLVAGSGEEAIALFGEHGESIDLLLTDVLMPGMSGFELAGLLKEKRPSLPVILISGFYQSEQRIQHNLEGSLFIQKPFTSLVLLEQIEILLKSVRA